MNKLTVEDFMVTDKRVLVRVDFNVPIDKNTGEITDETRIIGALPTLKYLVKHNAKVIVCSHMGRPKGKFDERYSLKPVAKRLSELIDAKVTMAWDVVGEDAQKCVAEMNPGEIVVLENVRFHPEEEQNDPAFAKKLASFADIYINDAFGTAHRAHASTAGVAKYLPAACGFLIQKELEVMTRAIESPDRPLVVILGGAKVGDKIGVIRHLIDKVDTLIIGGGMAYTFLKAQGYAIGDSILEEDRIGFAQEMMQAAKDRGVKLLLPRDVVIADKFAEDAQTRIVKANEIPDGWQGLDIGPETSKLFQSEIRKAGTVMWNGPMGVFEMAPFAQGTKDVATAMLKSHAITIVGGGDSAAAVTQLGFADGMTHVSTGGGACLEFLEGRVLPGIAALNDKSGRRPIMVGNWKMNLTPTDAVRLAEGLKLLLPEDTKTETVVCPPFVCIPYVRRVLEDTFIKLGAQNMHQAEKGAYTGEVSGAMLKDAGVEYVIIGHSERRTLFGETDDIVNQKVLEALSLDLKPIICVGETREEREDGLCEARIRHQVKHALAGVKMDEAENIIIAYEPLWAIGTGNNASVEDVDAIALVIRDAVTEIFNGDADKLRILYGGSVTTANVAEYMNRSQTDGGLVGGASLKARDFARLVTD